MKPPVTRLRFIANTFRPLHLVIPTIRYVCRRNVESSRAHMSQSFRLHWLRENGCDAGILVRADQLEPAIRQRALKLAASDLNEVAIHLPFLDKREWTRREEILRALTLERRGDSIVYSLPIPAALRDRAAMLALSHPAWTEAPADRDPPLFSRLARCLAGAAIVPPPLDRRRVLP